MLHLWSLCCVRKHFVPERDAELLKFLHQQHKVPQRAPTSVQSPHNHRVELPTSRIANKVVEPWTAVLRARDDVDVFAVGGPGLARRCSAAAPAAGFRRFVLSLKLARRWLLAWRSPIMCRQHPLAWSAVCCGDIERRASADGSPHCYEIRFCVQLRFRSRSDSQMRRGWIPSRDAEHERGRVRVVAHLPWAQGMLLHPDPHPWVTSARPDPGGAVTIISGKIRRVFLEFVSGHSLLE